jgi:hypothetical protein
MVWLLVGLFSFVSTLSAAVPTLVNHQGRLLDSSDNPVPDGPHVLIFSLYAEPDAGIPLWTETRDVVTKEGLFSLMLGSLSPLDLSVFDSDSLYLQIQLAGEAPMTPRLRIGSVPAAAKSGRVSGDIQTSPGQVAVGDIDGDGFLDLHSTTDQSELTVASRRPGKVKYGKVTLRAMPDSVVDYRDADSDDDGLIDSRMSLTLGGGGGAGGSILIEADLEGDGVGDVGTESSSDLTRSILKTYFERGDKPTQSQIADTTDELGARVGVRASNSGQWSSSEMQCTPDSAVQTITTTDGSNAVVNNTRTRLNDLETKLIALGLLGTQMVSQHSDTSTAGVEVSTSSSVDGRVLKGGLSSVRSESASLNLTGDDDGDGVPDNEASLHVTPTTSSMAIKTKGTGAEANRVVSVSSSTGSSLGGVACDLDDDGDGFLEYRAVCTVTDADGDEGSDMRCVVDSDDDGVDDNEASLHVTPTTSSMAIKTKGTGADKNRSAVSSNVDISGASVVCSDDSDDDGVDDTDVSLNVTPTTSAVAINTKGTGADKNRTASITSSTAVGEISTLSAIDDDDDGISESDIEQHITPTKSSLAINSKGTSAKRIMAQTDDDSASIAIDEGGVHVAMKTDRSTGAVRGAVYVYSGGQPMVTLDSDGDGYLDNALGVGVDPTHRIDVAGGAYCDGTNWVNASDENVKENFESVDGQELLGKISELEVTKWNYKGDADGMKHIGPTAQDFKKVFDVGSDGKTISTIDPSGIALAAIKELYKENISLMAQVADLMKQVEELKTKGAATDELRAQVKKLTTMVETIMATRDSEDNTTKLTSSH